MVEILLVEDNEEYRANLKNALLKAGYTVDDTNDALTGVEYVGLKQYNLVISALMMDIMDGNRLLSFVKKVSPKTKTMILTDQPTVETEILAIGNGIDRYLKKSIDQEVLIKYIDVLLAAYASEKEPKPKEMMKSEKENLTLWVKGRKVEQNGEDVSLTTKEFGILYMLLGESGRAIKREEFIEKLWDRRFEEVDVRVVDVHIKLLRKKMGLTAINTIRGYGYKWDE
ncbi:MAG: response regulator transcription factor [Culicoidibacterales bacterium]